MSFRSGFVALVGRPNVGKSTLLNKLVGQKIAITSPVVQTTRHRIRGVVTTDRGQLVFLDTPGFSKPLDALGNYLNDEGSAALSEADALCVVVDASLAPGSGDAWVVEQAKKTGRFIVLVLNKMDQVKKAGVLTERKLAYQALMSGYSSWKPMTVSAHTGRNVSALRELLFRQLPVGKPYYDPDALTDQRLREMSAELIRESVLHYTREEIPHSVAVALEAFREEDPEPGTTTVVATLYVDQNSQKGVLIGKNGQMIKQIGIRARKQMETLTETHVRLELQVKVKQNWRKDRAFLAALGLAPPSG